MRWNAQKVCGNKRICHCEPFAFCHSDPDPERSEGEGEESQHTAQGKPCSEQSESIREAIWHQVSLRGAEATKQSRKYELGNEKI